MSVIEDLYNGKICPVEDIQPKSERYRSLANEIGDEREHFASKLPEEDRERFKKWNEGSFLGVLPSLKEIQQLAAPINNGKTPTIKPWFLPFLYNLYLLKTKKGSLYIQ